MNKTQEALKSEDTFGTVLLVILVETYGMEAVDEWSPPTIVAELEDDYNVQIPNTNIDKLMAALAVIKSNAFYVSLPDFIRLCNALSGGGYHPAIFDPADAQEIAWGVTEALLLNPPDDENSFNPEIIGYIDSVMRSEGFAAAPNVLASLYNVNTQIVSSYEALAEDDPELFQTAYGIAQDKTKDVDDIVRSRLSTLSAQLAALPLRAGNAQAFIDRINQLTG